MHLFFYISTPYTQPDTSIRPNPEVHIWNQNVVEIGCFRIGKINVRCPQLVQFGFVVKNDETGLVVNQTIVSPVLDEKDVQLVVLFGFNDDKRTVKYQANINKSTKS